MQHNPVYPGCAASSRLAVCAVLFSFWI